MRQPVRRLWAKRWGWALIDVVCWVVAVCLATWLRLNFDVSLRVTTGTAIVALGMAGLHVVVGALAGPYAVGHRRGSFDEIVGLGPATLLSPRLTVDEVHPLNSASHQVAADWMRQQGTPSVQACV